MGWTMRLVTRALFLGLTMMITRGWDKRDVCVYQQLPAEDNVFCT